jgi:hypothetical protein
MAAIVNDRNAARGGPALDFLVQWVYRYGSVIPGNAGVQRR